MVRRLLAVLALGSLLPACGLTATPMPTVAVQQPTAARLRIQHRGGGSGFGSEMRLYPNEGLGMVVIANDTTYDRDAILDLAAQLDWADTARVALAGR